MGSNAGRRARKHQHREAGQLPEIIPERRDVTVIAGVASASGGVPSGEDSED